MESQNKIRLINRKALDCRESNRSTNYIAPDAVTGCFYSCSYCYMRRNKPYGLDVVKNFDNVLQAVENHVETLVWPKKPDQTHETYWTYDIGCNTDVALHYKQQDYTSFFELFKNNEKLFGSFATKRVNKQLLKYNPNKKMRIRFSIMPEVFRQILEPKTNTIQERLEAVQMFYDAGWDVHLNFSPVIAYNKSSNLYEELFKQVDLILPDYLKKDVKSEVIFLTHDEKMHAYNIKNNPEAEEILWQPKYQEFKQSTYGGKVIRYNHIIKTQMTDKFKQLHNNIIPWNTIRYIF